MPTFFLALVLSLPVLAGVAIKRDHWQPGSTIHIELKGASPMEERCLKTIATDVSRVVPLTLSFHQEGELRRPDVRLTVGSTSGARAGTGGHSDTGNRPNRIESMAMVFHPQLAAMPSFDETECRRLGQMIVLHEFGHMLGLVHEHRHPDVPPAIADRVSTVVPRYYRSYDRPIRDRRRDRHIYTTYDIASVMHYYIPLDQRLVTTLVESGDFADYFRRGSEGLEYKVLHFGVWSPLSPGSFFSSGGYSSGDVELLQSIYGRPEGSP